MTFLLDKSRLGRFCLLSCLFVIVAVLVYLAWLRIDIQAQAILSLVLLSSLALMKQCKRQGFVRVLFLILSGFLVLRYFFWRTHYTLAYEDFYSFIGAIALYCAEAYGILMFFLSAFTNIRPLRRQPVPLTAERSAWPSVDVIIPSYDEPFELVKITLAAASNIDYPAEKLNIYLLDDGGTQQKLNAENEQIRRTARNRADRFKRLCSDLNIHYLSRERNVNAKAGNMNAALEHLHGELILVLDADHAPAVDILTKTVGAFIEDERIFLVQTPHFFINPDPLEKNLNLFYRMPPENYMFYRSIQRGLDFWQSSFFCGSAAVLRRQAIDEVGGFSGVTITEDSETALKLHGRGWKSHYLFYPLISGLQPETFASFMIQRMRWAQGMVQNFILNNPLKQPKLRIWQRLCYLSSMTFWFFPFARLIFLVAPGLYLCFGLKIYKANQYEFLAYTVPYLLALLLSSHYLFSRDRWIFVSEIYETMQSLFSIRAICSVFRNPRHPHFAVTPKMETLEREYLSPLSKPFYWVIGFTVFAVSMGLWKFWHIPEARGMIVITLFWACFNLLLLLAALGVLFEQKQRRVNPRIPVHIEANWVTRSESGEERRMAVTIEDISMGGSKLVCAQQLSDTIGHVSRLEVFNEKTQCNEYYPAAIINVSRQQRYYVYGIKFDYANLQEYADIVRFVHGDSSRWVSLQNRISSDSGLWESMRVMIMTGIYYGLLHLRQRVAYPLRA